MSKKAKNAIETLVCVAFIVLLAMLALSPAIIFGKAPCDLDAIFFCPPWEEARPVGLQPPSTPEAFEYAQRSYPWYAYIKNVAQTHDPRQLLWNPNEGCGLPFWAVWRTRCLSPFTWPFYALPMREAILISTLLKLIVAGCGAYYAARRLGFTAPVSLAAGVAFEFSGHIFLWHSAPMSDVVPWLPVLFIIVERLAIGQFRRWPVGAIVIALMALGGEPDALATSILLVVLYLLLRLAIGRAGLRHSVAVLVAFGASVLVGLALVAIQIVPFIEFVGQTASTGRAIATATLRLKDLAVCFIPGFFSSTTGVVTEQGVLRNAHVLKLLHFGLIQLWLLALWFAVRRNVAPAQRRRVEAALLSIVLCTALAMFCGRLPANWGLSWLPAPEYFLLGNALLLSLVSVAAADEWIALSASEVKSAIPRLLVFFALLVALGVVCVAVYLPLLPSLQPGFWTQAGIAILLTGSFVALMVVTLLKPSGRIMGYGLSILLFFGLFIAFGSATKYTDRKLLFPETSVISALKESGERVGGSNTLVKWPLGGNMIPQVYNPSGILLKRQAVFFDRVRKDPRLLRKTGAPALLLSKEDIQGTFASVRPMLSIERVFPSGAVLFTEMGMKPRAWLSYDCTPTDKLDPEKILPDGPPIVENAAPVVGPVDPAGKVVLKPTSSSVRKEMEVDSTTPALLVVADSWYPGWHALVDGTEVEILPVDGMFQGVCLKEGHHVVEFHYKPFSVELGMYISLAALLLILIELRHILFAPFHRSHAR